MAEIKVIKGEDLLFMPSHINNWNQYLVLNFLDKYTYINFHQQSRNLLLVINTTQGEVVLEFSNAVQLNFHLYSKDQLLFTRA